MDTRPIGMVDSGFGGIGVLAAAAHVLPQEDFIFFGDNQNAPYGEKTRDEVIRLTESMVKRLMDMDCKAIVIACNTATSAAADILRGRLNIPIIGMEPALKPAALLDGDGSVLVLATEMTLRLEKFHRLMDRYGAHAIPIAAPEFVKLVESGETEGALVNAAIDRAIGAYLAQPVKAVVLGCTHFVFLRRALRAYLPENVAIVDGNLGTARQLRRRLQSDGLLNEAENACGRRTFLTSGDSGRCLRQMERLYQIAAEDVAADSAKNASEDA